MPAGACFARCDGLIGVAAPCDYRPVRVAEGKIQKTGQPLELHLIETPDVVATLGAEKQGQWLVGFALETDDHRLRALAKLEKKSCDLMVLNGPQAMRALDTDVEIIDRAGPGRRTACRVEGGSGKGNRGGDRAAVDSGVERNSFRCRPTSKLASF